MTIRGRDVDQLVDNYFRNWVEAIFDRREGKIGIHEDLTSAQGALRDALRGVLGVKAKERADG
jgi:hypothetical protein